MLEGKELEGKIGSVGGYEIDVDAQGYFKMEIKAGDSSGLEAGAYVKGDVVSILEKLAVQTDNKIDDTLVAMVKARLGRAA